MTNPTPDTPDDALANDKRHWHGPKGELLVAIQFVLMAVFALTPTWNPWASDALLSDWAMVRALAAIALIAASVALGLFGFLTIRRFLTPLPYPVDHSRLVTHGVYGVVRHPLYSSLLLVALGWVCWSFSLSHLALLAIGLVFFNYKATREEHWLTERHPEYPTYARRVKKLVPWVY